MSLHAGHAVGEHGRAYMDWAAWATILSMWSSNERSCDKVTPSILSVFQLVWSRAMDWKADHAPLLLAYTQCHFCWLGNVYFQVIIASAQWGSYTREPDAHIISISAYIEIWCVYYESNMAQTRPTQRTIDLTNKSSWINIRDNILQTWRTNQFSSH